MRMGFTALVLLFISHSSVAQLPYNHRLENGQVQAIGQMVYELETTYLGIGRGLDTTDFLRGIYATEFDKESGTVVSTSKVTYPNSILFFDQTNSIIEVNGKPYFLFSRSDTIYLSSYSYVDHEIYIEKKLYAQDPVNSLFIYDFQYLNGIFYVLSDHTSIETGESNPILFEYNKLTDSIKESLIINPDNRMLLPQLVLLESGNRMITYSISIGEGSLLKIMEIDSIGNNLWSFEHNVPLEGDIRAILPINNNKYVLGGRKGRLSNDPDGEDIPYLYLFDYNQKNIVKKSDFNIPNNEWFKFNWNVTEIIASHDNVSFLCTSRLYNFPLNPDTLQSFGMIAKVDHDFNVIWKRLYSFIEGEYNEHRIKDIITTSDGNYLAYGTAIKTYIYPGEIPLLSWAIKIDEDGKIVGDTTTATVEWENVDFTDKIEIFPNPASDHIYINQNDIEDVQYSVYDLNGRFIESFTLSDKNQSVVKSVDKWGSGYHIIRLVKGRKSIGSIKILKI